MFVVAVAAVDKAFEQYTGDQETWEVGRDGLKRKTSELT
jgi:hypothetical protein